MAQRQQLALRRPPVRIPRGNAANWQPHPVARAGGPASKLAVATNMLRAAVEAYRRLPARRRAGGGGGGQSGVPSRRNRRRPRRALQMPQNVLYQERNGRSDFTGMSTKALQKKAWEYHPASSNLMAPRGLGYYDAFAMNCASAVTSMTIGPTTPITGITVIPRVSTDYSMVSNPGVGMMRDNDAQLLIIGPARGRTQARLWRAVGQEKAGGPTSTEPSLAEHIDFDCTQLTMDQPTDGIPARCSVQVKNFSNAFARGGRVRVLRATTGRTLIPTITSNEDLWELMDGIRSHWRTATYDGEDFTGKGASSMQKNCIVLDQTRTLKFEPFDIHKPLHESDLWWEIERYKEDPEGVILDNKDGMMSLGGERVSLDSALTVGDDLRRDIQDTYAKDHDGRTHGFNPHNVRDERNVDVDSFTEYTANPTFTPIFILFEPCVTGSTNGVIGNEYEIKICSQFHCHFKQGSTLANMAKEPRTSLGAVTSATQAEEGLGSYMKRALVSMAQGVIR